MFEHFQLPDVAVVARRTMVSALLAGVAGLVVLLLFSESWAALGLCIGIGLGIGNFRLVVHSVLKVGRRAEGNKRRPLALNTLGRLMVMTVIALALAWVEPPLGLGIIGGLALFQFLLLGNVTRSMLKAAASNGGLGGAGGGLALLLGSGLGLGEPAQDATGGRSGPGALGDGDDAGNGATGSAGGGAA